MKTDSQKEKIAPVSVPGKAVVWVCILLDTRESNHKILPCKKVYFSSFTVRRPTRNKVYHPRLNFSQTTVEMSKWLQMPNLILGLIQPLQNSLSLIQRSQLGKGSHWRLRQVFPSHHPCQQQQTASSEYRLHKCLFQLRLDSPVEKDHILILCVK